MTPRSQDRYTPPAFGRAQPLRGARWVATITMFAAAAAACAQAPATTGRELLNSERIEQRFGSYGIAVLASDARVRVSNLYSNNPDRTAGGGRICRTFAVVQYPAAVDPAFAAEHAAIVDGGSIGAVFAASGWRVLKAHLRYDEIAASARLAELLHVQSGTRLARHAYLLSVEREGTVFAYAAIAEIHHPDYLTLADLRAIYGSPNLAGHEAALAALLATAEVETLR